MQAATRPPHEVRSFLIQSDLSVENVFFRLKPKSSFLTESKKELFRLNFFRLRISTGGDPVEKLSRKSFTRAF